MASYNKVILLGNLTRDPELRYTPKGAAVAKLGLAVNRKYTLETGESREEVTFIDIEAWSKQAELIGQYCRKGSPLFVEGRLRLDQWGDKNTGHGAQKPVELYVNLLQRSVRPGMRVLDSFAGSGPMLEAAAQLHGAVGVDRPVEREARGDGLDGVDVPVIAHAEGGGERLVERRAAG